MLIGLGNFGQAQNIMNMTSADGLPSDDVSCLTNDAQGNMWFGTNEGLAKYDGVSWTIYTTTSHTGLPDDGITAILEASNGDIWVGTDFGVGVFDGSTFTTYTTANGLGHNRINDLVQVSNGDIWISDFNGATVFDGNDFTVYGSGDGLPFGGVNCVGQDKNGDILLGTGIGGLAIFDGVDFALITETDGLVSDVVNAIAVDSDGNRWVGTANGLTVLDPSGNWLENHTRMLIIPEPDTLNPVEDIQIDQDGNVWVGIYVDYLVTVGGVTMFDGSTWTEYDESNGLVGPTIRQIDLDTRGNLWVGTSSGVSRIDGVNASVEDIAQIKQVHIKPNPASTYIDVKLEGVQGEIKGIAIYDAAMREVGKTNVTQTMEVFSLSVSSLGNGVYFLKIGDQTTRFVVAR